MALNLSQTQDVVAELAEVAAKAHSLVAVEYAGTTVEQMTAMRKKARETGVFLKVVKNTLASRAVAGTEYEVAQDSLVGPLLYAFSTEEPGARHAGQRAVRACPHVRPRRQGRGRPAGWWRSPGGSRGCPGRTGLIPAP